MNSKFYFKFALNNLAKNSKTIVPFALTVVLSVMMFYNVVNLMKNDATGSNNLFAIMSLMVFLIGVFSGVFLFYTSAFLIKQRKKELGLYNVLGLEKKHISIIVFIENAIISAVSIILGLVFGILFSRLIIFAMYKIINFDLKYQFSIDVSAVFITVTLFTAIFVLISFNNIIIVYKTKAVEMLKAEKIGEVLPKSNILLILLGAVTLISGYAIAITIEDIMSAISMFMLAVVLVAVGNFCFFAAFSTLILKALKNNKRFYFKPQNFIAVSGLLFRIKKNAMGLTIITVLSTGIIIMIAATSSMYVGFDEMMDRNYSHDIKFNTMSEELEQSAVNELEQGANKFFTGIKDVKVCPQFNFISNIYNETSFLVSDGEGGSEYTRIADEGIHVITVISQSGYNALTGEDIVLKNNDIIIGGEFTGEISYLGMSFKVVKQDDTLFEKLSLAATYVKNVIVMSEETFANFYEQSNTALVDYSLYFNLEEQNNVNAETLATFNDFCYAKSWVHAQTTTVKSAQIAHHFSLYGSLFFAGIFLSVLFIFSILLIIYYKQIIEGYEDKSNYAILHKVGMSSRLSHKSVNRQIIMVFLLPVIASAINSLVAFRPLTIILSMLGLTNTTLFFNVLLVTIAIFILVYIIMYSITSNVYKKIVDA